MTRVSTLISCFLFCALAQVQAKPGYGGTDQEWGTIEIRPGAHAFWWLYYVNPPSKPPNFDVYSRPLIIWLQGGPGFGASGIGNFLEIGPFDMNGNPRNTTWVNDYNILFVDAPIGSGFSHADSDKVYSTSDRAVAEDVISVLKHFLETFPTFKKVPTYLVGQSYGGKIAIRVAWELGSQNFEHNLRGVGLGSPAISSLDTLEAVPSYAFHLGFIDAKQKDAVQEVVDQIKKPIEQERWTEAVDKCGDVLTKLWEYTEPFDYTNILQKHSPDWLFNKRILETNAFMNKNVRPVLNVTADFGAQMDHVFEALLQAYMKPAINYVGKLLNQTNLKVIVYSGQLDFSVPIASMVSLFDQIFEQDSGWSNANRTTLVVDNMIEGYQKHYRNFSLYWVFRAGHWAPPDNPYALRKILQQFIGS
ncbi:retinoid-inducible serine carboxypeptidase-like isoform X2 [Fopius arisanus]|uniref:Retinoid-inducible serine carboxypeptidase-like isoform X2 n=1 Tax=Fopius arisanus TaxID=64838 RepID=A0A9R1U338_9HYME|nr:PREDICTED: retinoid-inducible serine carboxypeptidase-like isoform X2 [Fopius arisanus]